jgi:hypothetical protein
MAKTLLVVVLWVTVIWRSPAAREEGKKRTLWLALACLAVALTIDLAPVISAIDSTFHVADLATLLKHLMGIASCVMLTDWIIASTQPERLPWHIRRRHEIVIGVAAALVVLFFLTPRVESTDFSASAAGNAWAISYLLVFELYLGFAMLLAAQMFSAAWPDATSRLLRAGLMLLTFGTVVGVIYAVTRSAVLIMSLAGRSLPDGTKSGTTITDGLQAVAIGLILVGLALPACESGWRAARNVLNLLWLRPLWSEVTTGAPQVLLFEPPTLREDLTGVRRLGLRLVRASVEIRDASRHLRTYLSPEQVEEVRGRLSDAGLSGGRLEIAFEACLIGAGLAAKAQGAEQDDDPADLTYEGADLDSDLYWTADIRQLRKVAAARRSSLVRRVEREVISTSGSSGLAQPGWATS